MRSSRLIYVLSPKTILPTILILEASLILNLVFQRIVLTDEMVSVSFLLTYLAEEIPSIPDRYLETIPQPILIVQISPIPDFGPRPIIPFTFTSDPQQRS